MNYIALYRKFRPQRFEELAGQKPIAATLAKAVATGNTVHAYLFCGPRGTGKTSAAKILARAVNCEHTQNGSPCGECEACRRIAAGESLDILEIDAASNRGIDEIRDLCERVKYASATERCKVYIIDEVHMLTQEAFNALLKTLEEPPANVMFILATTEPHKVLPTIISRCQRFDFKRIPQQVIYERLRFVADEEHIAAEDAALRLIAKKSQGGLRDALGLLDQCHSFEENNITSKTVAAVLGTVDEDFTHELADAVLGSDIGRVLDMSEELVASGKDMRQFLYDLTDCFRDMLKKSQSDRQQAERIFGVLEQLSDTEGKLRYALQPQTVFELCLIRCCGWTAKAAELAKIAPAAQKQAAAKPQHAAPDSAQAKTQAVPAAQMKSAATAAPAPSAAPQQSIEKTTAQPSEQKKTALPIPETEPQASDTDAPQHKPDTVTLSAERVAAEWQQLLDIVKGKSITLNAFLQHAKPGALHGKELRLDFVRDYAVHMSSVMKQNNKSLLEHCLQQQFGTELTVRGELVDAEPEELVPTDEDEEAGLFD